jgi:hypothetical protein
VLGLLWPIVIAIPAAALGAWIGISLLVRAWKLRRAARSNEGLVDPSRAGVPERRV